MPMLNCSCCDSPTDEHKIVKCSICKKIFRHTCVDLTVPEVRAINGKKGVTWSCVDCSGLGNDIRALQTTLLELKAEIGELKKNVSHSSSSDISNSQFEEILQELNERQRRKSNIIIFGLPEDNNDGGLQTRAAHDKETVVDVLRSISVPLSTPNSVINAIRIGKVDNTRDTPRPLKVILSDENAAHTIIKKAPNLRNIVAYRNLRISFDRTPRQIEFYRSVKAQLTERLEGGETNLKIKYFQGIPKIVSLN